MFSTGFFWGKKSCYVEETLGKKSTSSKVSPSGICVIGNFGSPNQASVFLYKIIDRFIHNTHIIFEFILTSEHFYITRYI